MKKIDLGCLTRVGVLIAAFTCVSSWLVGCAQVQPLESPAGSVQNAKNSLQFIDLQSFDHDLFTSMNAALPHIEVSFYDKVTPSELPVRLQNWMVSVESGGGSVKVIPAPLPPSTVTTRSPLLLIGLVTSLWTANKMAKEVSNTVQRKKAGAYDAEIRLKTDDSHNAVVDKVVFIQRKN